jgi:hypothetical protein
MTAAQKDAVEARRGNDPLADAPALRVLTTSCAPLDDGPIARWPFTLACVGELTTRAFPAVLHVCRDTGGSPHVAKHVACRAVVT